ncbi:MAG: dodecin domain-containing protein [Lentisphaerae bacterium]|nr:MAG: dodecin domain-containing protein [Lentisphaerota bacterium]
MSDHVYAKTEVVGSSQVSIEDAVNQAVAYAAADKSVRWAEVKEIRCHLEDGKVAHWQVTVAIGYRAQ